MNFWNGARDEYSFKTHFIGAILSVVAILYVLGRYLPLVMDNRLSPSIFLSFIIFTLSMLALYSCSAIYHYSNANADKVLRLRKLDHSMIYVLIAGTYTPILYNGMTAPKSFIFLSSIWAFAFIGIIVKVCWMNAPRWLSTAIYLLMGWSIVFDLSVLKELPTASAILMILGGLSYTVGAIMYIIKKPNIFKKFGFHEIFHVFIMIGTLFHFYSVLFLVNNVM